MIFFLIVQFYSLLTGSFVYFSNVLTLFRQCMKQKTSVFYSFVPLVKVAFSAT